MGSKSIPAPLAAVALAVVLAAIAYFAYHALTPRQLGQGYTPGVPPWMEKGNSSASTPGYPTGASTSTRPAGT